MEKEKLQALEEVNQLRFTEEESLKMQEIFTEMENKEELLLEAETEGVKSMVYVRPMYNVLREDRREQPFSREDLLKGAPQATEDSWQVPRLVK